MLELSNIKNALASTESQRIRYAELINEYKQRVAQLESENEELKRRLDSRFDNQEMRIESAIEIAKKERENVYDDITNLIKDHERFQLNNLLEYSPSQWLNKRNPVVIKFIETLTYNENENQHENEKLFKCAVTVNMIYGIRHLKYVSAINLAASAIKYSIARSKSIIDINNHFINFGGYTKFIKWQENLADESQSFPKGLIFMAFDNEQKGQKII